MTVDTWSSADGTDPLGNAQVATYDSSSWDGALPGLEDFDASKASIPRVSIDHNEAKYVDSLTGEETPELDVIILGMVTQRILWPKVMGDSDSPLCKSRDGRTGYPLLEPNGKENLIYPFELTPFDSASMGTDENHNHTLECAVCPLKEWVGKGKGSTPPACSEQFTFVITQPDGTGQSLFTVQKTGMQPARRYITDFVRSRKPMFICRTVLTLRQERKGGPRGNVYCVPEFRKGEAVDPRMFGELAEQFRDAKEFITTPPQNGNGADGDGSAEAAMTSSTVATNVAKGVQPAATAPLAKPPARTTPAARPAAATPTEAFIPPGDEEELPF